MITVFGKLSMLEKEMEQFAALRDQARTCGDVHMAEDYDDLHFAKLLEFNTIIDEMKVVEQPTQFEQVLHVEGEPDES